jgi:MFS family permease
MQTRRWSRRLGWVLIGCGVFLTGMMGTLTWYTAPMLLRPGTTVDGTRFSGGPGMALVVLAIFGAVFAFGATALGYGVFQVRTGRRDKRIIYAMLGIWGLLLTAAYLL